MGQTIVSKVINALQAVDIRADEAYPGGRIPALTGAVAAVRLGKVDRSVRTTTVQITVMSPADLGGSVCESAALQTVEAIQEMGAICQKNICQFDNVADVFYIEIAAEFFGTAMASAWSPGPGFSVAIGAQPMEHAVRFAASRSTDSEVTQISKAVWEFTLEELLPPGSSEPSDPSEPFVITVERDGGQESFTGCTLSSVKREDTIKGVSQIRSGKATARNVIGVL